jgi:ZIP family zinc transporter
VLSTASPGPPSAAQRFHRAGVLTALAVTLHNFPEGLATFLAALKRPQLGASMAIAVAVHNIPEGSCSVRWWYVLVSIVFYLRF